MLTTKQELEQELEHIQSPWESRAKKTHTMFNLTFGNDTIEPALTRVLEFEQQVKVPVGDSLLWLLVRSQSRGYHITWARRNPMAFRGRAVDFVTEFYWTMGLMSGAIVNSGTLEQPMWGSHS